MLSMIHIHSVSCSLNRPFIHSLIHLSIHPFRSLSYDGPQPLPLPVLHTMQCIISSFIGPQLLIPLFHPVDILPFLAVSSTLPTIFPSIMRFRRHFVRNIWHLRQLFCFIVYRTFLYSFTVCNTCPFLTWSVQLISSVPLQHHITNVTSMCDILH